MHASEARRCLPEKKCEELPHLAFWASLYFFLASDSALLSRKDVADR